MLCAFGMLMSELKHDFVRTFVARLEAIDWPRLTKMIDEMSQEGARQLTEERIPESRRRNDIKFDCRYIKQYHEVSFLVPRELIDKRDVAAIARARGLSGVAPYFIDAAATPDDAGWPRAGLTVVRFRNQHLQYALTWFGLAVLTLWATWRLLTDERRMRHHGPDAEPSPSLDRHA